jgi:hypothetical protein
MGEQVKRLALVLAVILLAVISAGVNGASAASKVKPSPSPKWPPVGFTVKGEIYAKVPTVKELVGIASNSKVITAQLAQKVDGVLICKKYSCGAITVASKNGCSWWEVRSRVIGPKSLEDKTITTFGTIRTTTTGTEKKVYKTILLISSEDIERGNKISNINVICHHAPATETLKTNVYTPTQS